MSTDERLPLSIAFSRAKKFDELAAICPHCGAYSTFKERGAIEYLDQRLPSHFLPIAGKPVQRIEAVQCAACRGLALGAFLGRTEANERVAELLWPTDAPPDNAPTGLEAEIKKSYDEARRVLSLSPTSAAVLCRRCVQHVIRAKLAIKCRTLFDEIKEAVKRPELTKTTAEALDHVRLIGNWGAHPSEDQASLLIEVSEEEAKYTLDVLELLFHDLYASPAKVSAMQAKLAAKK